MTVEPRLYLDVDLSPGVSLALDKDQSHYLVTVMRRKSGDGVRVFNGRDGEWRARVTEAHKRAAVLTLSDQLRPQRAAPDITLYFAPVKKARTDFIVEKATELGVAAITPVMTARTMAERVRTDRLNALVREAAEQTERLDLPAVNAPVSLTALLKAWDGERRLIFADEAGEDDAVPWGGENGRARPIAEALGAFASHPTPALPSRGGRGARSQDDMSAAAAPPLADAGSVDRPVTESGKSAALPPSPSGEGRGGGTPSQANPATHDDARYDETRFSVSEDGEYLEDRAQTPAPTGQRPGRPTPNARALAQARRLRADPTEAERALWALLQSLKAPGFHFRRQAPIGPYVADFACLSKRLIIEADGGGHGGRRDLMRDAWLETHGYRVLRFWNNEITENPDGVGEAVLAALAHPTPALPSREGRGASSQDDVPEAADDASGAYAAADPPLADAGSVDRPVTESGESAALPPSPSGEGRGGGTPSQANPATHDDARYDAGKWALLIGPEGGFSPEERELLRQQAFVVPVSLGPRILRADTAVAAALSVWQAILGDWR